jgi:hypothetical protein
LQHSPKLIHYKVLFIKPLSQDAVGVGRTAIIDIILLRTRDSSVGIATSYGLDGIRVPVGSRIFSSPRLPDRFWGPPSLLYNVYRGLIPRG